MPRPNKSYCVTVPCRLSLLMTGLALLLVGYGSIAVATAFGPMAHKEGAFGPLHAWPIIPIAMMMMPDERVLAYGSDIEGKQGGKLYYAIWDPSVGTGEEAFEVLFNTTDTDIFCAGQSLIPGTGQALIIGGDKTVNGKRNYANSDVNIFDPATDSLTRQAQSMTYERWYATAVTMPSGEHVILGGRMDRNFSGRPTIPATSATYAPIPEIRAIDGTWRVLDSAASDVAYGAYGASWYYPRAWVSPQGDIFIIAHNGRMYRLETLNPANITRYKSRISSSRFSYGSVMFAPGRILSIRKDHQAVVVDINGEGEPVVSATGSLAHDRKYGTATVLADGKVWVNGGSSSGNSLSGQAIESELWDPDSGVWTVTASAATARLYHSSSLLLADGTVITGGGGAPGPLKQLNGEIFYPPYLFRRDGSGNFSKRPRIKDVPEAIIGWDQVFSITASQKIGRVTLVRLGAVTHNFNNETRFFDLPFEGTGRTVTVQSPVSANLAPPGYYMLFVWNIWGYPSIARVVQIG